MKNSIEDYKKWLEIALYHGFHEHINHFSAEIERLRKEEIQRLTKEVDELEELKLRETVPTLRDLLTDNGIIFMSDTQNIYL